MTKRIIHLKTFQCGLFGLICKDKFYLFMGMFCGIITISDMPVTGT